MIYQQVDEEVSFRMSQIEHFSEAASEASQAGSPSLLTGMSTPISRSTMNSENKVTDRFNGILYHVTYNEGQISARFSSKELYQKFVQSLNKELHPKQINDTKATYQTHLQGKWCSLTTDSKVATIYITGPAQKQWRETVFLRLAIHLYQQYVQETDDIINESQNSQTSTPTRIGLNYISPPISPVGMPADTNNTQYEMAPVSEISEQIKELQFISKHLQEQLTSVNTKLDILLQRALDMASISTTNSLEEDPQYVTINATIEEEPQVMPGSSTYRDVVMRNPTDDHAQENTPTTRAKKNDVNLTSNSTGNHAPDASPTRNSNESHTPETNIVTQQNTNRNLNQNANHRSSRPARQASESRGQASNMQRRGSKIIIIGDSILTGVNRKGLAPNIECQPYSGANIDVVYEKVQMFDLSKFSDIVIYVGGNDSSDNTDIEYFEEKYEQLLHHIKNKNPICEIHLCTSCPRGDTDVEDVNDVIKRLCEEHQVKYIDTNAGFYDKHHQLRTHFYKPRDSIHLSRSGIKRVLGLINETLYIVENFEKCVYPLNSTQKKSESSTASASHQTVQYVHNARNDGDRDTSGRGIRPSQNHNNQYRYKGKHRSTYFYQNENECQYPDNLRCLKCGLTNHSTGSCHHKTQVQCFNCKLYGHKDTSGLCRRK